MCVWIWTHKSETSHLRSCGRRGHTWWGPWGRIGLPREFTWGIQQLKKCVHISHGTHSKHTPTRYSLLICNCDL